MMTVSLKDIEKKVYAIILTKNTPLTVNEIARNTESGLEEINSALTSLIDKEIIFVVKEPGFPDLFFPRPPLKLIREVIDDGYSEMEKKLSKSSKEFLAIHDDIENFFKTSYSSLTEIPAGINELISDYTDKLNKQLNQLLTDRITSYKKNVANLTENRMESLEANQKAQLALISESKEAIKKGYSSISIDYESSTERISNIFTEYHSELNKNVQLVLENFEESLKSASSSISESIENLDKILTINLSDSFSSQNEIHQAILEEIQKTIDENKSTTGSSLEEAKSRVKSLQKRLSEEMKGSILELQSQLAAQLEDKKEDIYQFVESRIKETGEEIRKKVDDIQTDSKGKIAKYIQDIDETKKQLENLSSKNIPSTVGSFAENVLKQSKIVLKSTTLEIEKNLHQFERSALEQLELTAKGAKEGVEDLISQSNQIISENIAILDSMVKEIDKSIKDWKKTSSSVKNTLENIGVTLKKRMNKIEHSLNEITNLHNNRIKEILSDLNKNFEMGVTEDVIEAKNRINSLITQLKELNVSKYETNVNNLTKLQSDILTLKENLKKSYAEKTGDYSSSLKSDIDSSIEGVEIVFQELLGKFKEEFSTLRDNSSIKLSETEANFLSLCNISRKNAKTNILISKNNLSDSIRELPSKLSSVLDEALESMKRVFDEIKQETDRIVEDSLSKTTVEFDSISAGFESLLSNLSSKSSEYMKEYTESYAMVTSDSEAAFSSVFQEKKEILKDLLIQQEKAISKFQNETSAELEKNLEKMRESINTISNSIGESLSDFSSSQDTAFEKITTETMNILTNVESNLNSTIELTDKVKNDFSGQLSSLQQEFDALKTENQELVDLKVNDAINKVETDIGDFGKRTGQNFNKTVKDSSAKLDSINTGFLNEMKEKMSSIDGILAEKPLSESIDVILLKQKEISDSFTAKVQKNIKNTTETLTEQISTIIASTEDGLDKTRKLAEINGQKVLDSIRDEAVNILDLLNDQNIGEIKVENLNMIKMLLAEVNTYLEKTSKELSTSVSSLSADIVDTLQEINDSQIAIGNDTVENITAISASYSTKLSEREEKNVEMVRDNAKKLSQTVEVLVDMMAETSGEKIKPFLKILADEKSKVDGLIKESRAGASELIKKNKKIVLENINELEKELIDQDKSSAKLVNSIAEQAESFFSEDIEKGILKKLDDLLGDLINETKEKIIEINDKIQLNSKAIGETLGTKINDSTKQYSDIQSIIKTKHDSIKETLTQLEEYGKDIDVMRDLFIRPIATIEDFSLYNPGFFKRTMKSLVILAEDKFDVPLDQISKLKTKVRIKILTKLALKDADDKKWLSEAFNSRSGVTVYALPQEITLSTKPVILIRDDEEVLVSATSKDGDYGGYISNNKELALIFSQLLTKIALKSSKRMTKKQL